MSPIENLPFEIQRVFSKPKVDPEDRQLWDYVVELLRKGSLRAAEPEGDRWRVNLYVKQAILIGFRVGVMREIKGAFGAQSFHDKDSMMPRPISAEDGVRIVPGGATVRDGAYLAKGVVMIPPSYINVGAYVDENTLVDSNALVGSCAQVGKRVHISAGAQIGGVLEPAGALPVVVEDDVLIGGNCGVYEGTWIRKRAVLGSGVVLTASTKVYDLVHEKIYQSSDGQPLTIPEGAVVVPGARKVKGAFAEAAGLTISTPLIIKYRDEKTDARTALESALRPS